MRNKMKSFVTKSHLHWLSFFLNVFLKFSDNRVGGCYGRQCSKRNKFRLVTGYIIKSASLIEMNYCHVGFNKVFHKFNKNIFHRPALLGASGLELPVNIFGNVLKQDCFHISSFPSYIGFFKSSVGVKMHNRAIFKTQINSMFRTTTSQCMNYWKSSSCFQFFSFLRGKCTASHYLNLHDMHLSLTYIIFIIL